MGERAIQMGEREDYTDEREEGYTDGREGGLHR
jgi:hypothetical protein